jgi:hypothetical protein
LPWNSREAITSEGSAYNRNARDAETELIIASLMRDSRVLYYIWCHLKPSGEQEPLVLLGIFQGILATQPIFVSFFFGEWWASSPHQS